MLYFAKRSRPADSAFCLRELDFGEGDLVQVIRDVAEDEESVAEHEKKKKRRRKKKTSSLVNPWDGHLVAVAGAAKHGFEKNGVPSSGLGIRIMRERVRAIDGQLQIDSVLKRGTTVEVQWARRTDEER